MIARVEFDYSVNERFVDLAKSDEIYKELQRILPDCPGSEAKDKGYNWPRESLIELETDGRWLVEHKIEFKIKTFKGTMSVRSVLPNGDHVNVYVQVPHVGLLSIDEAMVEEDCCTDNLNRRLNEGWRILCVCPPNAARRPDYILGRTKERS